ncbi:MAG: IclR family transcriptional regulator [Candidatus Heteroscillospira sp.]|jgi:DNA-binding IclR family transcriptional regulator
MVKINKSASRTIDVLKFIAGTGGDVVFSDIVQTLELPKSSAFELLYTLESKGVLNYDKERRTYSLGLTAYEIFSGYLNNLSLYQIAKPYMQELVKKHNITVNLALESGGSTVYLEKLEGDYPLRTSSKVGSIMPIHTTALGRAILATYDDSRIAQIMSNVVFSKKTEYTIDSMEKLMEEIRKTRKFGYSVDDRECSAEMVCIGVPIFNRHGLAIASISFALFYSQLKSEQIPAFGEELKATAAAISRCLGYRVGTGGK